MQIGIGISFYPYTHWIHKAWQAKFSNMEICHILFLIKITIILFSQWYLSKKKKITQIFTNNCSTLATCTPANSVFIGDFMSIKNFENIKKSSRNQTPNLTLRISITVCDGIPCHMFSKIPSRHTVFLPCCQNSFKLFPWSKTISKSVRNRMHFFLIFEFLISLHCCTIQSSFNVWINLFFK